MEYFDDIEITGVSKVTSNRRGSPRVTKVHAIGVLTGQVQYLSPAGIEQVRTPCLYWGKPGYAGDWDSPDGLMRTNIWIVARGERFKRMVEYLSTARGGERIYLENPEPFIKIFERMLSCFESGIKYYRYRLPVMLEELMALVAELVNSESIAENMQQYVKRIAEMMEADPGSEYDLKKIAADYKLSELYLRKCFTRHIGTPPGEYLATQRYALALRLLCDSQMNITDIAECCGFSELRTFSMFFKQRAGQSPRQFRKNG